jgi:hypothetical protein
MKYALRAAVAALAIGAAAPSAAQNDSSGPMDCRMTFSLSGWSAFYKTASGTGKVTCSNGETAAVTLKLKGGGITFGTTEIRNGTGKFSEIYSLQEIYGGYAAAEAHAGAGKSAEASVYTKGRVSLALSGKGRGINLGVAFGKLTVSPAGQ